jgi:hypothetical protein
MRRGLARHATMHLLPKKTVTLDNEVPRFTQNATPHQSKSVNICRLFLCHLLSLFPTLDLFCPSFS